MERGQQADVVFGDASGSVVQRGEIVQFWATVPGEKAKRVSVAFPDGSVSSHLPADRISDPLTHWPTADARFCGEPFAHQKADKREAITCQRCIDRDDAANQTKAAA
jgi:hypothetical protein